MPYDGSGNATRAGSPVVNTNISDATDVNTPVDDIISMLNLVLLRDGRAPMSGVLDMGNNRITALAAATGGTDALSRNAGDARYPRYDGAQTLTAPQSLQARANIAAPAIPTGAAGAGSITATLFADNAPAVLPAGGTHFWILFFVDTASGQHRQQVFSSVNAGGATIGGAPGVGARWSMVAWRIA